MESYAWIVQLISGTILVCDELTKIDATEKGICFLRIKGNVGRLTYKEKTDETGMAALAPTPLKYIEIPISSVALYYQFGYISKKEDVKTEIKNV